MERLTIHNAGFDPYHEAVLTYKKLEVNPSQALGAVAENLRTYEEELLQDRPVVYYPTFIAPYHDELRIGDAPEILLEKSLVANQIDPLERDGLVSKWWSILETKLLEKTVRGEHAVFLAVSPRGKRGTQGDFIFKEYPYHAVYLGMTGDNGEIRNWALKMNLGEEILFEWVNFLPGEHELKDISVESFLTTPVVVGPSEGVYVPQQLIQVLDMILKEREIGSVYTTRQGEEITVEKVLELMKTKKEPSLLVKTAARRLEERIRGGEGLSTAGISEAITEAYLYLMRSYAEDGVVEVSGCVGTVNLNDIFGSQNLLKSPLEVILQDGLTPFASSFSLVEGSISSLESKSWEYHQGNCVVCQAKNIEVGPCNICKICEKRFDKTA